MKEDTKWRLRDIEGKEYIIIDSEKVDMQEELNKMITKQMKEIERLNNIINNGKNKVQEVKEHLDKSGFDGMTKSILIMALNEIIYSLNGDGSNE